MILHRLALQNFKSYRDVTVDFPAEGLIGVVGKNGAGKSTIFEAILFALYGRFPLEKELVRHAGTRGKDAVVVELTFTARGNEYTVQRELRGKSLAHKAKLLDEKQDVIAEQGGPVTEEVARLLGLDETAFTKSVFARQKELTALSSDQAEHRKANVRRMLGLERIDKAYQNARSDHSAVKSEMEGMAHTLLSDEQRSGIEGEIEEGEKQRKKLQEQVDKARKAADKMRKEYEQAEQARAKLQQRKDKRAEVEKKLAAAQSGITDTQDAITALQEELKILQDKAKQVEALQADETAYQKAVKQKGELIKAREHFNERQRLADKVEAAQAKIKEAETRKGKVKEEVEKFGDLEKELAVANDDTAKNDKAVKKAKDAERKAADAVSGLRERIEDRERKLRIIRDLGPDAPCPTCQRPMSDDYQRVLDDLDKELSALQQKELTEAQGKLDKAQKQLTAAETEKTKIEKKLSDLHAREKLAAKAKKDFEAAEKEWQKAEKDAEKLTEQLTQFGEAPFDPKQLEAASAEAENLEEKHVLFTELKAETKRIPQEKEDLKKKETRLKDLQKEAKQLQQQLTELPFDEKEYAALVELRDTKIKAANDAVRVVGEFKNQLVQVEEAIKRKRKQLTDDDNLRRDIAVKQEKADDLAACAEALRGFKTSVLAHVTPEINRLASQLFDEVTRGRYVRIRIDEDFDFRISDEGEEYPIRRFSGGEIDLANLCLRIAIGRVVAQLNGQRAPGLLAFDEIFGSQDDDRRRLLVDALRRLKGQVLVISHLDAVKDEFHHTLQVSRDAAGSRAAWI